MIRQVNLSKRIKRTGWVRENIPDPESVAEHIFGTVFLAMVLGPKLGVDREKLVRMALIHDISETKTGDLIVERGKEKMASIREQKDKLELEAIRELFEGESQTYIDLFKEMQEVQTPEARVFKQLDKLEMAIQALEYEIEFGKNLTEFFDNTQTHLTHPYLREIFAKVLSARPRNS